MTAYNAARLFSDHRNKIISTTSTGMNASDRLITGMVRMELFIYEYLGIRVIVVVIIPRVGHDSEKFLEAFWS